MTTEFKKNDLYILEFIKNHLSLRKRNDPPSHSISVDFVKGKNAHRRKFGGGRKQNIARAVGLKNNLNPIVIDATAGLGRDAFILASLGCRVHMLERSPVIRSLLEDGLKRAKQDKDIGGWIKERLFLLEHDSCQGLESLGIYPDVVYLDPMFSEKKKNALVKKEMQILQSLLGFDEDSDKLLNIALKVAKNRVVVKRSAQASYLANKEPNTSIKTQKNRFDIYLV